LEGAGQVTSAEEFVEFAEAVYPQLRRTAFLLCGDWHTAEDLAQTALEKVFVSWRKIRQQDAVHAYTHRTLINSYLAHKRLKHTGELLTGWFPERAIEAPAQETRIMALDALATLPPRTRAVVVLRYWTDLSVEQVADVLGCSPGNVKRLSAYAIDRLRTVLGDELTEPGSSDRAGTEQRSPGSTLHG
jgi:RNA polymerase sigma-70 factor (sigma-E family)